MPFAMNDKPLLPDNNFNYIPNPTYHLKSDPNASKNSFISSTWFCVLMLILCFPIGIIIMNKYKKFNSLVRSLITILCLVCFLGAVKLFKDHHQPYKSIPNEVLNNPSLSQEYKDALIMADFYAIESHFSKESIYETIARNKDEEAAKFAVDNIVVDWNENALKSAQQMKNNKSKDKIYEELTQQQQFTEAEAQYAIDNLK